MGNIREDMRELGAKETDTRQRAVEDPYALWQT